jgi:hypothetical protein
MLDLHTLQIERDSDPIGGTAPEIPVQLHHR